MSNRGVYLVIGKVEVSIRMLVPILMLSMCDSHGSQGSKKSQDHAAWWEVLIDGKHHEQPRQTTDSKKQRNWI